MVAVNELACVLVLYRKTPEQSHALENLRTFFRARVQAGESLSLLIYDNSPAAAVPRPEAWEGVALTYRHDSRNLGLAVAYNMALQEAAASGRQWLLLLDQDTHLNAGFLDTLLDRLAASADAVCALVPKLRQGKAILSPTRVMQMREQPVKADFEGVCEERVTALNSGACLRVATLEEIGGFPLQYPLDYLDHAVFFRLQQTGGKVQVIKSVLEHHLSLLNLNEEMSLDRYTKMLAAERRFVRESSSVRGEWILRLRLLKRSWDQAVGQRSFRHAWTTLGTAFRI
jgi:GT2 family glycosyltransferase